MNSTDTHSRTDANPSTDATRIEMTTIPRVSVSDIEVLTSKNYKTWAQKMKFVLSINKVWVDPSKDFGTLDATEKGKCEIALGLIGLRCDCSHLIVIQPFTDSGNFIEAWMALAKIYSSPSLSNIVGTARKLFALKLEGDDDMQSHVMKMRSLLLDLEGMDEKLSEKLKTAILLTSVEGFDAILAAISSWESSKIKFEAVSETLIEAFNRKVVTDKTESKTSYKSQFNFKNNSRNKQNNFKTKQSNFRPKENFKDGDEKYRPKKGKAAAAETGHEGYDEYENANFVSSAYFTKNSETFLQKPKKNRKPTKRSRAFKNANCEIAGKKLKSIIVQTPTDFENVERKVRCIDHSDVPNEENFKKTLICHDNDDPYGDVHQYIDSASSISLSESMQDKILELDFSDDEMFAVNENKEIEEYQPSCYNALNNSSEPKDKWIIDSGATDHMCNNKKKFRKMNKSFSGNIKIANGSFIAIKGKGSVIINVSDGTKKCKIELKEVLYVPTLHINLLSVTKFCQSDFKVDFMNGKCSLIKNDEKIFIGKLAIECAREAFPCLHEWHRKLAHRNLNDIKEMGKFGLKINKCLCDEDCIACIKGKSKNLPFPHKSNKPEHPLDLVVSDLNGPMDVQSQGGAKYFITFTDAATDYTEISTLRQKSDAKIAIKQFIEKMKTQTGRKPKILRSDRGGEFIDGDLQTYLKNEGIKIQLTVHDCPQQNGIAERKNLTLLDAVRSMIYGSNLPKSLWGEALHNAVYTQNRIIRKGQTKPPIDFFFKRQSESFFFEFGHPMFVTTKHQGRKKLDERAELMKFLSVDDASKGFRLWNGKRTCIERHVKPINSKSLFYETQFTKIPINETLIEDNTNCDNKMEDIDISAKAQKAEVCTDPGSLKEAMNSKNRENWLIACTEELNSIEENKTWSLVDLPKGRKAISSKWVFKEKKDQFGNTLRFKARLVAKGFTQKQGIDYQEVFAPVARSTTFRTLLAIASKRKLLLRQYDVKTAFLNGELKEEIYLKQPEGFEKGDKVLRLHKSLYGLKQAANVWNTALNNCLTQLGFHQSKADNCLYIICYEGIWCYMIVHVDDCLFVCSKETTINELASKINKFFELKSLGEASIYLGIEIQKDENGIYSISQKQYINQVVKEAGLENAKSQKFPLDPGYFTQPESPLLQDNHEYRKLIGILLYISTNSRPDVSAAVCILAQRIEKPRITDLNEVKRVIKYLKTTADLTLKMMKDNTDLQLQAYSDANWGGIDPKTAKSNSGIICFVHGGAVGWSSKKQSMIALSTTESEFYALAEAGRDVIWLKQLMTDLHENLENPVKIRIDSQSCQKMVENGGFSPRTRHINVRYHYVKDMVKNQEIKLEYCETKQNIADMFTKPLPGSHLEELRKRAGLI